MWKIRAALFSIPAILLLTIAMGTASLVSSLFDPSGFAQHQMARWWSKLLLRFGAVRCRAVGVEKLDPAGSYVFASNHASYMDTPAVLSSVPLQFRFFAKKGLFGIPFLGWHLRRAGHIPVIREDPRASIKSMTEGAKLLTQRGVSLLLFPEGGRSETGMREFREGAAFIAIKAGVPVVPIGLVNTREVLPMHSAMIRSGTIEVRVGDPIDTSQLTTRDRDALTRQIREQVEALIQAR